MGKPDSSSASQALSRAIEQSGSGHRAWLVSLALHAAAVCTLALLVVKPGEERGSPLVILDTAADPPLESPLDLPDLDMPAFEMLALPETPSAAESPIPAALLSPPIEIQLPAAAPPTSLPTVLQTDGANGLQSQPAATGEGGAIHAVVGDYDEALDQITRELIRLLKNGDVTVVWLFDQSTSMIDDREQIGRRFGRIYDELYESGFTHQDALTTGIASFSGDYLQHTANPTSDRRKIDSATREVPIDPIGIERTCHAVLETIAHHRRYVERTKRQFALIVVTDESGDPADNNRYLEEAIDAANQAKCHVYVLGREAMFGYRFVHAEKPDPITGKVSTLTYDRGPETGFAEQLQTDGFGVRCDSILSGFGPYDQVRLTQETGGIFFMLPDQANSSADLEQRKNRDASMSAYRPDWRPRYVLSAEAKQDPLQVLMTQVILELNPHETLAARSLEIHHAFVADIPTLASQVRQAQAKMLAYVAYLDKAIQTIEQGRPLHDASANLRQRANYELLLAELLTFRIRAHEFHAYLAKFRRELAHLPPPATGMTGWRIAMLKQPITPELSKTEIERARHLLEQIVQDHPGTPWAARAQAELDLGFAVALEPF